MYLSFLVVIRTMAADLYSICLDEFETKIKTTWQELQTQNYFCDVTLVCDENQIQAHRIILSSISPVFRNILMRNPNNHPLIFLRGVNHKDLQNLVHYIYQGMVNIAEEDLNRFLSVAEDLKIEGLSKETLNSFNLHKSKTPTFVDESSAISKTRRIKETDNKLEKLLGIENDVENVLEVAIDNMENDPEYTGRPEMGSERKDSLLSSSKTSNKSEIKKIGENTKPKLNCIKVENASVEEGVRYSCDVCDHTSTTKGNLKMHVRSIHEGSRYSCHLCNFKATQRCNLKVHIESVHERIRYSCNHCDYKASQKSNLYTHNKKYHIV